MFYGSGQVLLIENQNSLICEVWDRISLSRVELSKILANFLETIYLRKANDPKRFYFSPRIVVAKVRLVNSD